MAKSIFFTNATHYINDKDTWSGKNVIPKKDWYYALLVNFFFTADIIIKIQIKIQKKNRTIGRSLFFIVF
jgi:hypothetical protein